MELDQYLGIFIDESKENLQRLNESLLKIESTPDNLEILNDIFRVAHTLKGMSRTMGFNTIADLTHNMENVLEPLRSAEIKANSKIVDVLFKCLDRLEGLVNKVVDNSYENDNQSIADLVSELQGFIGNTFESSKKNISDCIDFNEYDLSVIDSAISNGFKVFEIFVSLTDDCLLKGARAYMAVKTLEPLGEIVKTCPESEDLENGEFDKTFYFCFLTQTPSDEIRLLLEQLSEVQEVNISELNIQKTRNKDDQNQDFIDDNNKQQDVNEDNGNKASATRVVPQTIRVSAGRMDRLMNLVGELVINKTRIMQLSIDQQTKDLNMAVESMGSIITEIQEMVMSLRMVAIEQVFNRFPRLVRDISKNLNKDVNFKLSGQDTEIDRVVIDEIGDPLVHLIRNSLDHGLETPEERIKNGKSVKGSLELIACTEGDNVIIKICDDGRGIDPEKIKSLAVKKGIITSEEAKNMVDRDVLELIFRPGFSTVEVATDISGRGVGMDVVKSKITQLGGNVSIVSVLGQGTTVSISLPSTMSIVQALLIKVGSEIYAAPLNYISEVINIYPDQIKNVQNNDIIVLRGKTLPLVRLSKLLEVPEYDENPNNSLTVVIVKSQGYYFGFVVSELIGQQEIVIKPINKKLCTEDYISGATTLGNGQVALILNVSELLKSRLKGVQEVPA